MTNTNTLNSTMTERTRIARDAGPVNDKMRDYIEILLNNRIVAPEFVARIRRLLDTEHAKGGMTFGEAKRVIDWLKTLDAKGNMTVSPTVGSGIRISPANRSGAAPDSPVERVRAAVTGDVPAVGLYAAGSGSATVYYRHRTRKNRGRSGYIHIYESIRKGTNPDGSARMIVRKHSSGEANHWKDIKGFRKTTADEALQASRMFRHCMVCGRPLSDPNSVDRGIGPVCAGRIQSGF